ncbi:MAG: hypothetical protein V4709_11050 [Pseudomonadota bacterium]
MNQNITESAQAIAARMDSQRAQLRRQFLHPPQPTLAEAVHASESTAMQPYEPRSFLMKLLKANPQLIQRVILLAVTTAIGARYSSWAMKLFGLFLAVRKKN